MGYSQEVRQRTLTPSFRWFESIYPNQKQAKIFSAVFVFLYILSAAKREVLQLSISKHKKQNVNKNNSELRVYKLVKMCYT